MKCVKDSFLKNIQYFVVFWTRVPFLSFALISSTGIRWSGPVHVSPAGSGVQVVSELCVGTGVLVRVWVFRFLPDNLRIIN